MSAPYHVGWCPFCNQGWQVVERDRNTRRLFVHCQECLLDWDSPGTAKDPSLGVFQKHDSDGYATREDLLTHSWVQYVKNLDDAENKGVSSLKMDNSGK
jgi:hypothetical protein